MKVQIDVPGVGIHWLCKGCRHVVLLTVVTTERQAIIDHLLDSHRDDLISGQLQVKPGSASA